MGDIMKIQKIASENLRYVDSRNEMVPTPTYAIIGNSGAAIGKLYKGGQGFETMHTVAYVDWCIEIGDEFLREFPSFTKAKDYIESVQFTVGFRRGGIFDHD